MRRLPARRRWRELVSSICCGENPGPLSGQFVFKRDEVKPSREGLRAAGAPPCAPQAKILGDKPSREGFRAETLPGGF